MQLQSLFSTEEKKSETLNALELNISQLVKEILEYLEEIRNLTKLGFNFSMKENKFHYTQDGQFAGIGAFFVSNTLLMMSLPGSGLIKMALIAGITGAGVYKYFSRDNGLYKNRMNYVRNKTTTLESLLKNDTFKVSLIVNIEKDFNTLEEKFQSKPETLSMVKKKRTEMINELKTILVEEDLNHLPRLLGLLTNIKEIEEQTQKLLKLDSLNHEVHKQLNAQVTESEEENEVTEKIKALL